MIPWFYGAAEHFPFLMASHYITAKWRKWRRGNWDLFQRCSVCVFWTAGLFSKHVRVHVGQAEVNSRLLWPAAGLSVFRLVVFSKKKRRTRTSNEMGGTIRADQRGAQAAAQSHCASFNWTEPETTARRRMTWLTWVFSSFYNYVLQHKVTFKSRACVKTAGGRALHSQLQNLHSLYILMENEQISFSGINAKS